MNKFQIKYPILAAPMNKVSDLEFAIKCYDVGILPSISVFNYFRPRGVDYSKLKSDLNSYRSQRLSNVLFLSTGIESFMNEEFSKIIETNSFNCIEIIDENGYFKDKTISKNRFINFRNKLSICRDKNIITFFKILDPNDWLCAPDFFRNSFDGCVFKSADASGSVIIHETRKSLMDEFLELKKFDKDKIIVPTGGISTPEQVKDFIANGAELISIGSYFAVSEETPISYDTKLKIIKSNKSNLSKFGNSHNALIFSTFSDDDTNHTRSLKAGLKDPIRGHVYMGSSIENIKEIKPLKKLVEDLVRDLI